MKKILFASLLALATLPAYAADASAAPPVAKAKTAQQQRMTDCNAQAAGKKGDERKTFMSSCLKGASAATPAAASPDADKQAACEANAKSAAGKPLAGAAKTSSIKACMKKAA
jgi:hypothetical protein